MTIRKNLVATYIREELEIRKRQSNLRPIKKKLTYKEWREAEVIITAYHLAWLKEQDDA